VLDGIRYAVARRDLLGSYLVDLAAMTLAFPIALFPFMASDLHAEWAQGLLFSAGSLGAVLASATSGWAGRVRRHGRAIALSAAAWGAAIAAFGLSDHIAIALAFLVIAGGMDMLSGMFRVTLWNQTIPDDLRGRIAGLEGLSYSLGPVAGQLRGGVVAGVFGARAALWSGGLACVGAVVLICVALPQLWRHDARGGDRHIDTSRDVRAE
jgi:MFS family permease